MYNIFWFRRDLRLMDNCGLYYCLNTKIQTIPVFIFDSNILQKLPPEDRRVSFIFDTIIDLKKQIENHNSSLLVLYGNPVEIYTVLIRFLEIDALYFNHDYEPYAIERDNSVKELFIKNNKKVFSYKDQVIFEKNEILNTHGKPLKVYSQYKKNWFQNFKIEDLKLFESEKLLHIFIDQKTIQNQKDLFLNLFVNFKDIYKDINEIQKGKFPEPLIEKIYFKKTKYFLLPLNLDQNFLESYKNTRDFVYLENGVSNASVYLRFGLVSIRKLVQYGFSYSIRFIEELIWREFYMYILFHFPYSVDLEWNPKYQHLRELWRNPDKNEGAKKHFDLWCEGKTGYPLVDAGICQLNQTGYIHNRVRMVCASFLVKDLLIDWKFGERYFSLKLMDFELASNVGNWQWCSGTGVDAAPYFRIFNPYLQQKKFDPDFVYIKKWIPEVFTNDYPLPIVDHNEQRKKVMTLFNE